MKYIPKCDNTRAFMLSATLLVAAASSLLFAGQLHSLKWLFQLLFLSFATASIQILIKYVLTSIEFVVDEEFLLVYRSTGKRKALSGKINLQDAVGEIERIQLSAFKADTKEVIRLIRNFKAKEAYKMRISTYGGDFTVLMEISEEFANALSETIMCYRKGSSCDDV